MSWRLKATAKGKARWSVAILAVFGVVGCASVRALLLVAIGALLEPFV